MKRLKIFLKKYLSKAFFWIIISGIIILMYLYFKNLNPETSKFYPSLINGIISGIVTALLIFIFQILWRKNFLVWIENLLFQDVKIEGDWSGFIVPYIGLKDLDKLQKEIAWREFQRMKAEKKFFKARNNRKNNHGEEETKATIIDSKTGEEQEVSAEVILHSSSKKNEQQSEDQPKQEARMVSISPTPIIIKAQLKRVGHSIKGKIIEIGGASDIHTYSIEGSFKNLILTATYESTSEDHIDRGALSLMLLKNGEVFEGFFSSYADQNHRMIPMRCFLSKKNKLNTTEDE